MVCSGLKCSGLLVQMLQASRLCASVHLGDVHVCDCHLRLMCVAAHVVFGEQEVQLPGQVSDGGMISLILLQGMSATV